MIRVLLVDDQALFRAGLRVTLDAQDDIEVVGEAGDGQEAVDESQRLAPDVVLMDLRMPEVDGVQATRRIHHDGDSSTPPPKVIVLTTFDLDDRAAEAIRYGASGFLIKTCTPRQLHDAVRTVHAGNAVLEPAALNRLMDSRFPASFPPPPEVGRLTPKERQVLDAVVRGMSNAEIGSEIFLSESTVKTHVGAVLRKLGLRDRVQIVVYAHEHGLT